ncbi:MAG: ornithine cyclodeaminase family protein [Candidatus Omnitrophica bacterium]|nr:ornithine cyclodeaminase family protein [Candidatus Omnitrophota bacterium]
MRPVLVLTRRDVARVADLSTAIRVVRAAFISYARGQAVMPPKIYLPLPRGSDFRAMPAYVERPAACGVKWVNVHPNNPRRGLPSVMATIVLNDPATGEPLAVMDGSLITKLRTAAAAAVAAHTLARPDSRVVALVGCGGQADAQLLALAQLFHVRQVQVWGHRAGEAAAFCQRMRRVLRRVSWTACRTIRACVRSADLVVTLTPAHRPLVARAWLSDGTHLNAIGADAPGKQELDPRILREATVVVDDYEQAVHGGELNVPVRRGQFDPKRIHASLGEVLIGRRRGRRAPRELTVFDSTGLAIHDVALAAEVFRRARRQRLGCRIPLV